MKKLIVGSVVLAAAELFAIPGSVSTEARRQGQAEGDGKNQQHVCG